MLKGKIVVGVKVLDQGSILCRADSRWPPHVMLVEGLG